MHTFKRFTRSISITAVTTLAAISWSSASLAEGKELPSFMVPIEPTAAEAYWAPDSRHLIAQTKDADAVPSAHGGKGNLTYVFTDDGKEIQRVNDRGQDGCSYFFPDQKRVVFTSTRDNMDMPVGNWSDPENYPQGAELYSADLDGGNIKRLTNNQYYEAEVSVSPNGEWITFGRQIDGNMDIWVMRSDGTDERKVTNTEDWHEGAPFFMNDNEHIIFRAWKADDFGKVKPTPMTIFTINKDGSNWRRHTFDRGMNWHPHPAPDGRHYVYVKALGNEGENWEIYLGDLVTGEHKRLTYSDKMDILATVSPDGKKMAWGRSTGKGFGGIRTFVMDVSSLNLGPENVIPFDPTWGELMPRSTGPK
jgi:Tol biopolymer transport system component